MSDRNNPVPQNMHAWMRQMERRMSTQERRPSSVATSVGLGSASNLGKVVSFYGPKVAAAGGGFNPQVDGEPDLDWLVLDGSSFSQLDYPQLASHLGGTTLPNATDKAIVAAGVKALGTAGGSATVTLTSANLPPHIHPYDRRASATAFGNANSGASPSTTGTLGTGNTQDGGFANTPVNIQNPYIAMWVIIGAV